MFEVISTDLARARFKTWMYNGRNLINPPPTNIQKVTSLTFSNGVVVSTDKGHYDSDSNRFFPVMFIHNHPDNSYGQWLSQSMTASEVGYIYITTPTPVRLRTYRLIGYKGSDTSRGALTNVSLEGKNQETGLWQTIHTVGHIGEGQDTDWVNINHSFSATEFRLKFNGVLHVSNRFAGLKRLWLYV